MTIMNVLHALHGYIPSSDYLDETKEFIYSYEVHFRCSSDKYVSQVRRQLGDMVIVHCDRGYNIGFIGRELDPQEMFLLSNGQYKPKKIIATLPTQDEKISEMLISKIQAENHALEQCRSHCEGRRIGALTDVLGAEFQFDRKKLTIFMKLYENVSVCRLVRKLYDTFKMRVKVLEVDSADIMEERARKYLELSKLNIPLHELFDRSTLNPNKPFLVEQLPQTDPAPVPQQPPIKPKQQQMQRPPNSNQINNQKKKNGSVDSTLPISPDYYRYLPSQGQLHHGHKSHLRYAQDHYDYHQATKYPQHMPPQMYAPAPTPQLYPPHQTYFPTYTPHQVAKQSYQPDHATTYPAYRSFSPNVSQPPPAVINTQRHSKYQYNCNDSPTDNSSTRSYASSPDSYYYYEHGNPRDPEDHRPWNQDYKVVGQQAFPVISHPAAHLPFQFEGKNYSQTPPSDYTTPSVCSGEVPCCDLGDDVLIQSLVASLTLPKSTHDHFESRSNQGNYLHH